MRAEFVLESAGEISGTIEDRKALLHRASRGQAAAERLRHTEEI